MTATCGDCPQCHHMLEQFENGSVTGVRCQFCGWSVVRTNHRSFTFDPQVYIVSLTDVVNDAAHVRAVSKIKGINFLQARNYIQTGDFSNFLVGRAVEINKDIEFLKKAGVNFTVSPEYPYLQNAGDNRLVYTRLR
ncbi:hypothetical protein [Oryzifoliimicrobium ureilyticus]|uniref:hypothetical protein n=1 Tax=Oryzifoliimicrobium ureilyticus TaxID=3113724 RepID=UPI0030763EC5